MYEQYIQNNQHVQNKLSITAEYLKKEARLSEVLDKFKSSIKTVNDGPHNIFSQIIDIIIGFIKRLFYKQRQEGYIEQLKWNMGCILDSFQETLEDTAAIAGYRNSLKECTEELEALRESLPK